MPISFTEVAAAGDVLPNNRHTLYFPAIPDVMDGHELTVRHSNVSLPPLGVGQIIVKMLGWSVGFAGIRTQINTFTVEFVETVDAPVVKGLAQWQDICAGFKSHLAKMKKDYAVNPRCVAADTTGKLALTVDLMNVWPVNITYGQFTEDSGAAMVTAEFSVDAIDIVGLDFTEGDFEMATENSKASPSLWYQSRTPTSVQSGLNKAPFQASEQAIRQLGLQNPTSTAVLGKFF
ncbi:putative tail tube protein [Rhizobium phage RHph_I42]|nr:putative tail tube protein [Rhizobium phage RHph_I42]